MTVLGLMSGTSFDGLDLCCVSFNKEASLYSYKLLDAHTHGYTNEFVQRLSNAHLMKESELTDLEDEFDLIVLQAICEFLEGIAIPIDLISSHGHTVFHRPDQGITRQIGNGKRYYSQFKIPVVFDFRSYDVALGGQGAPLVPIGDALLFNTYDVCLNLGGISNISYSLEGERRAFDIGMFNTPINDLVQRLNLAYDLGGKIAESGKPIPELLDTLNSLSFFARTAPKSLGKEWYHETFFPLISSHQAPIENLVNTVTEHNVIQICKVLHRLLTLTKQNTLRVLITGGGAHNTYALRRMRALVSENIRLEIPEKQLIDYKEALIFAFMGYLRSQNQINVYSSVTGASKDSCAGTLILNEVGHIFNVK